MRWESIGCIFQALTSALLSLPERDCFFTTQRSRRADRKHFAVEMKDRRVEDAERVSEVIVCSPVTSSSFLICCGHDIFEDTIEWMLCSVRLSSMASSLKTSLGVWLIIL